jgi:hypothetical protein
VAPTAAPVIVAVLIVLTPWQQLSQNGGAEIGILIPAFLIAADVFTGSRVLWMAAYLCSVLVATFGFHAYRAPSLDSIVAKAPQRQILPPDALAETRWRAFTEASSALGNTSAVAIPVFAGLGALVFAAARQANQRSASRATKTH